MAKRKRSTKKNDSIDHTLSRIIISLSMITLSIIGLYDLGFVGNVLTSITRFLFGNQYTVVFGIVIVLGGYLLFFKKIPELKSKSIFAFVLLFIAFLLYSAIPTEGNSVGMEVITSFFSNTAGILDGSIEPDGGLIGSILYGLSTMLFAKTGTLFVIFALLLVSIVMILDLSFTKKMITAIKGWLSKNKTKKPTVKKVIDIEEFEKSVEIKKEEKRKSAFFEDTDTIKKPVEKKPVVIEEVSKTTSAATVDVDSVQEGDYKLPSITLLDNVRVEDKSSLNESAAKIKGQKLIEILNQFGINASLIGTYIGPSVTKFEVKPDSSIKVSKILAISDNIKMELAARDIRIEAPIPGRNAVGVEIPNVERAPVRLLELIKDVPSNKRDNKLLLLLGKDLMGKGVYCELDKMPHLLIAGATGAGKSVCVNSIISTILFRAKPDEVKLLLIDPKKVEFTHFAKVPHLIGPVISDATEASRALKVIVMMMENRYEVFSKVGVRNISGYHELMKKSKDESLKNMPWIVVIIDELADLMTVAGKEVEQSIQRITQLARAAGIHLIVATQRPSTDVITGIIKANIPSRIAFSVKSGIDSRTILDSLGAERLLRNGDMLYMPIGDPAAVRLQGVFMSDDEITKVSEDVSRQAVPHYDDAFIRLEAFDNGEQVTAQVSVSDDPLFDEVKKYIIESKKASTSSIQRRFGLGYNRAARIIDMLEEKGIIGPAQGSKPRDVYVKMDQEEISDEE